MHLRHVFAMHWPCHLQCAHVPNHFVMHLPCSLLNHERHCHLKCAHVFNPRKCGAGSSSAAGAVDLVHCLRPLSQDAEELLRAFFLSLQYVDVGPYCNTLMGAARRGSGGASAAPNSVSSNASSSSVGSLQGIEAPAASGNRIISDSSYF